MAEEPIKLGLGIDKASVRQAANDVQAALNQTLDGKSAGDKFASGLRASISKALYDVLSTRWVDPTFANVSSQFTSGMKRGVEQLGALMGDKLRQVFSKPDVDAQPLAEEIGDTVEKTLKAKIAEALVVDGNVLGGFSEGQFVLDEQAYSQRWGTLMLGEGGQDEFAEAVSLIASELSMAVEESARLEENGEQASEQYQTVAEMAETAVASLRELYGFQAGTNFGLGGTEDMSGIASDASNVIEEYQTSIRSLGDGWDWVKGKVAGVASTISDNVGSAFAKLGNTEFFQMLGRDAQRVGAHFKVLAEGVHKVLGPAQRLASMSLSGFKQGATTLIGKFKQLGKTASNTVDGTTKKMKRMTLQMIKAGLGVRGLYMLFRKLRQAIKEGMDIMAKEVPEFNAVFSDFKTALNQIKGSVGSAFQPILQVVLPILTQLLGMLNNVITAIAKFNAVLMGQGYIYKFTAAQQDYAKKLKGTGSAAKKAAKDLMGFDEINRLSDKKDSGGGAGDIGEYEKQMIDMEDAMSKFAQMVKDAWKSGDFSQVGKYIGEQLKSGLSQLQNWMDTDGQAWAEKLSKSLSSLINGLVDVDGLGYQLGSSIGSVLNVGITFLKDFWTDTNFTGIGEQVGGAINGLFDQVDWDGLGTYFGEKFNGIFEFIGGLATSTDWVNIGTSIAESLNTMIQTMDVGAAMQSVSQLLVGILQSGISFLTTTDFTAIGEKLADGLANIDWKGLLGNAGTLLTKGAQGILDMVIGFCKKTDWAKLTTDILDGIGTMFENVWDDGQLLQKLAEGFVQLFVGAFKILWNIGGWISENVVDPMIDNLISLFEQQDTGSLGEDIIMGLLEGIKNALVGIGTWLYDNLFLPIWNGIKDCFDIHSPSGKMLEIGLDLIAGLYDGLVGIWDSVKSIFDNLTENILGVFADLLVSLKEKWNNIKTGAEEKWEDIKTAVCNKVASLFRTVVNQFTNLKTKIGEVFRTLKETIITIWEGIWNGIKKVINWILGGVNDMISFLLGGINKLIQGLNGLSFDVPDVFGGGTVGFAIPEIPIPQIPLLAEGAVLPPNNPFLAMVGDQSSGTNVEAPLETIKQATAEVMDTYLDGMMAGFEMVVNAIQNKDTSVTIDGKVIAETNAKYTRRLDIMRGTT